MTSKFSQRLKIVLSIIAHSLKVAAGHVGRLFRLSRTLFGRHRARILVRESEIELGRVLAAAELGSKELLKSIKQVDERIASVQQAESSTKQLEIERRGLFRRLSATDIPSNAVEPVRSAYQAIVDAREGLRTADESVQLLRTSVVPSSGRQFGQLGLGYGLAMLMVFGGLWLWSDQSPKGKAVPTQSMTSDLAKLNRDMATASLNLSMDATELTFIGDIERRIGKWHGQIDDAYEQWERDD